MPLYQRAFYITPGEPIPVPAVSAAGGSLGSTLCVTPRSFAYNTYAGSGVYGLQNEGLVGIFAIDPAAPWGQPYADGGFRYVTKADGTATPLTFFSGIAALTIYGLRDEALTLTNLTALLKSRKAALRCGPTINVAQSLAASVGLTTRSVHCLNLTAQNGVDDGHVLLECQEAGKWVLYDVAGDVAHADPATGALLSLGAVIDRGVTNCTPVDLARHESFQQDSPANGNYPPLDLINEYALATPTLRAAWRKRIYEAPGIDSGGKTFWGLKPEQMQYASLVQGLASNWIAMPWSDWVAKFYPAGL